MTTDDARILACVLAHFGALGEPRDDIYPDLGHCWRDELVLRSVVEALFLLFSPMLFAHVERGDYGDSCRLVEEQFDGDSVLADVVVATAQAYWDSVTGRRFKWGLSQALRKAPTAIRTLSEAANKRCALCGWSFTHGNAQLDHILPWRFVRDPARGANWRLLCGLCNQAKSDHFSAAMTQAWLGWPAREGELFLRRGWPLRQAHYVTLARDRVCAVCSAGPSEKRLAVQLRERSRQKGLGVANLEVVCEEHAEDGLFATLTTKRLEEVTRRVQDEDGTRSESAMSLVLGDRPEDFSDVPRTLRT